VEQISNVDLATCARVLVSFRPQIHYMLDKPKDKDGWSKSGGGVGYVDDKVTPPLIYFIY